MGSSECSEFSSSPSSYSSEKSDVFLGAMVHVVVLSSRSTTSERYRRARASLSLASAFSARAMSLMMALLSFFISLEYERESKLSSTSAFNSANASALICASPSQRRILNVRRESVRRYSVSNSAALDTVQPQESSKRCNASDCGAMDLSEQDILCTSLCTSKESRNTWPRGVGDQ